MPDLVHCLDPNCDAPAIADAPIEHDSSAGPVLAWRVRCSNGHYYLDYTDSPEMEEL